MLGNLPDSTANTSRQPPGKPGTLVSASNCSSNALSALTTSLVRCRMPKRSAIPLRRASGFVDRRMLHFPKEASQHRDHLIFSLALVALPARAVGFERLNVAVVFDGVCSPGREDLTQFAIDFCQPSLRERKDANAGKVVQACQLWKRGIEIGVAALEERRLFAAAHAAAGAFAT